MKTQFFARQTPGLLAGIRQLLPTCAFIAAFLMILASPAMGLSAGINVSSNGIRFAAATQDVRIMLVEVFGPQGNVIFSENSNGSLITWALPGDAEDGRYNYEVKLSTASQRESVRSESDSDVVSKANHQVETLSGSVLVKGGSLIDPAQLESGLRQNPNHHLDQIATIFLDALFSKAYADIVHSDDVIVVGSECVGINCVNGESFGFDTLRLKETTLRVNFADTSSTNSFPTNDWRIIINDSANGGANYFAIEDSNTSRQVFRVSAGAPASALTVDSQGDVGIGTANAVVNLHMKDGNTPTTRLEQDGSNGFTPQTWDVAGNEANFFIRDVTNGSTLPFRIEPGAPTSSIQIAASGRVGIGTAAPGASLEVKGNAGTSRLRVVETSTTEALRTMLALVNNGPPSFSLQDTSAGGKVWSFRGSNSGRFSISESTSGVTEAQFVPGGNLIIAGNLTANGTVYASSRSLKDEISPVDSVSILEKLAALPVSEWSYKKDADQVRHIGPMAEDFYAAFNIKGSEDDKISSIDIIGVTMAAVQGLNQKLLTRAAEISRLRARLSEKDTQIARFEGRLSKVESTQVARMKTLEKLVGQLMGETENISVARK